MVLLSDVMTVESAAIKLEDLLVRLEAKRLNARGWESTRIARALVEVQADTSSSKDRIIYALARGGFPDDAEGPWLDLVGAGWFSESRIRELAAIVQLRLTDTANAGPYELRAPVAVAYPTSTTPLYYRSIGGTIAVPRGGSIDAPFVAVAAGSAYSVAPGQIVDLATPTPGVTVTSPAIGTTGSILIQAGQDEEQDAPFRARLKDKWGLLGRGWMSTTIRALIRQALPDLARRLVVLDPGGSPGIAEAYVAGATGTITATQARTAYLYLANPLRKPVGNRPVGVYPAGVVVAAFNATLYSDGTNPSMLSHAAARLTAYQDSLLPGESFRRSRIIDALVEPADGCIGAVVPSSDPNFDEFAVARTSIAQFNPTFTVVGP